MGVNLTFGAFYMGLAWFWQAFYILTFLTQQSVCSDLERLHVHERDEWEQKADAQMRSAVSAAEQAVKINGISKGDIDAELRYQAQQVPA